MMSLNRGLISMWAGEDVTQRSRVVDGGGALFGRWFSGNPIDLLSLDVGPFFWLAIGRVLY